MNFKILTSSDDVQPLVELCAKEADKYKNELGFLPKGVLVEAAQKGQLYIALDQNDEYCGHVLFGGRFPHLKVFQVLASERSRRAGVARKLVEQLIQHGESKGYLSISARVASDLAANEFWATMGFSIVRLVRGGTSRGRGINVRARDLATPSLFKWMDNENAPSATPTSNSLSLEAGRYDLPSFTIDLNVLIDAVRRHEKYHVAQELIGAALQGMFRLFVTSEMMVELARNAKDPSDPLISLVQSVPTLPDVPESLLKDRMDSLMSLLFGNPSEKSAKHVRRVSDVKHLALSIHHNVSDFITRDAAILQAAPEIMKRYGLEILGLEEASELVQSNEFLLPGNSRALAGTELVVRSLTEGDRRDTAAMLQAIGIPPTEISAALDPGTRDRRTRRFIVLNADEIVGVASWPPPDGPSPEFSARLYISEDGLGHSVDPFVEYFIDHFVHDITQKGARRARLYVSRTQPISRSTAFKLGFQQSEVQTRDVQQLLKLCFPGYVCASNHSTFNRTLRTISGWQMRSLPKGLAELKRQGGLKVESGPEARLIPLRHIEMMLAPVLFLFHDRSGVLVPIRRTFAKQLLSNADDEPELAIFGSPAAAFRYEKAYFRAPRGTDQFEEGQPIVFYESQRSGGRGVAIGIGRILESTVVGVEEALLRFDKLGVLTQNQVAQRGSSGSVHAFTFSGFQPFANSVSLNELKGIGAVDGANLVTPRKIGGSVLMSICEKGFGTT